jgi:hypothetical protein
LIFELYDYPAAEGTAAVQSPKFKEKKVIIKFKVQSSKKRR